MRFLVYYPQLGRVYKLCVTDRRAGAQALGHMFPGLHNLLAIFGEMNVCIDVVDPADGDEVMVAARARIALGQLDLIGAFHVIDRTNVLPVRGQDLHVFSDLRHIVHWGNLQLIDLR